MLIAPTIFVAWEVESRLNSTNINQTCLAFLSDGMFMLLCETSSKQTNKNNNETAKTLYGFLLLNDETEEKYPIDLEKPEPYLGFILSLH